MTRYDPVVDEEKLQIDCWTEPEESVTLVGEQEVARPDEGLVEVVIDNVPLNPEILVMVTLDDPAAPTRNVSVEGLEDTVKSGGMKTRTETVTEWLRPVVVAVTVIV